MVWVREANAQKECQDAGTDCKDEVVVNAGKERVVNVGREFRRKPGAVRVEYREVDRIEVGWGEG
jgi:hypothetical protein